jgi:hypothetical protein
MDSRLAMPVVTGTSAAAFDPHPGASFGTGSDVMHSSTFPIISAFQQQQLGSPVDASQPEERATAAPGRLTLRSLTTEESAAIRDSNRSLMVNPLDPAWIKTWMSVCGYDVVAERTQPSATPRTFRVDRARKTRYANSTA